MSVPDELVQAAAEALRTYFSDEGRPHALTRSEAAPAAGAALQAAFAKLPECEEVVMAVAKKMFDLDEPTEASREYVRYVFVALAREFGAAPIDGSETP